MEIVTVKARRRDCVNPLPVVIHLIKLIKLEGFYFALSAIALLPIASKVQAQAARTSQQLRPSPQVLTSRPPANAFSLGPVCWICIIDTSGSMSGLGPGATDIFARVKDRLRWFIREIRDRDSLTVYVFDVTSRLVLSIDPITGDSDRERVIRRIDELFARGARTHTGVALKDGLNEAYSCTDKQDQPRPSVIILFTDGREDVRGIANPTRISDVISLIPDQNVPYIFYIFLGTDPDPALQRVVQEVNKKALAHGHLFKDPEAKNLAEVMKKIVKEIEPRRPLKAEPSGLDLGKLSPGDSTKQEVVITSPVNVQVSIRASSLPATIELLKPDGADLPAKEGKTVALTVKVAPNTAEGEFPFAVRFEPILPSGQPGPEPVEVPVRLQIIPKPQPLTFAGLDPGQTLDLGRVSPSGTGGPHSIEVYTPVPTKLRITPQSVPPDLTIEGLASELDVGPSQKGQLAFTARVSAEAHEGLQSFALEIDPIAPPPELLPGPYIVPVTVLVEAAPWGRGFDAVAAWVVRYWLGILTGFTTLLLAPYFWWRWRVYGEPPWQTPLFQFIVNPLRRQPPAVLQTPEGPVSLRQAKVTLGAGGSQLNESPATIVVQRVGRIHELRVQEGLIDVFDGPNEPRFSLGKGQKCELKHGSEIMLFPYKLSYLNPPSARQH